MLVHELRAGRTLDNVAREHGLTKQRLSQVIQKADLGMRDIRPPKYKTCKVCGLTYRAAQYAQHVALVGHPARVDGPRPQLWHPRTAEIAIDYAAGMLINDIVAKYGIHPRQLMNAVRNMGVPYRVDGVIRRKPGPPGVGSRWKRSEAHKEAQRVRIRKGLLVHHLSHWLTIWALHTTGATTKEIAKMLGRETRSVRRGLAYYRAHRDEIMALAKEKGLIE